MSSSMLPHKLLYEEEITVNKSINTYYLQSSNDLQQPQLQQQQQQQYFLNDEQLNRSVDSDDNKAFDNVVFDILKVDPEEISSQLTIIDLPLFKKIQPDELISCKWMSRDKLNKAPNIVEFTKRFNQTTFWVQKEILSCKRLETRAKMVTHFIKIAKRLHELQNFNSLMAVIVALKSAPIYRLKRTWNLIKKSDSNYFDRISDIMFDTTDNKRKLREMHNNCKLPCIPFLGLYLTDLIHIDIAHPHNCFDNPQRRNQMNNICRILSDYQQSEYDRLVEISYVENYLNSFVYFEEFQKFKEDENYRTSLELEPEPNENTPNSLSTNNNQTNVLVVTSTPRNEKYINVINNDKLGGLDQVDSKLNQQFEQQQQQPQQSISLNRSLTINSNNNTNQQQPHFIKNENNVSSNKHRKTLSLVPAFVSSNTNSNDIHKNSHSFACNNDLALKHPLDDSIIEDPIDTCIKIHDASLLKDLLRNRLQTVNDEQQQQQQQQQLDSNNAILSSSSGVTLTSSNSGGGGGGSGIKLTAIGRNLSKNIHDLTSTTQQSDTVNIIEDHASDSNEILRKTYEEKFLQQLSIEQKRYIVEYPTAAALLFFESTIKRKCIMKNQLKPRFSKWHTYWVQLIGNVMIYYPSKLTLLPINSADSIASSNINAVQSLSSSNQHQLTSSSQSLDSDNSGDITINIATMGGGSGSSAAAAATLTKFEQQRKQFHKDPCKMHTIANWMVVALFQDDLYATTSNNNTNTSSNSNSSNSSRASNKSLSNNNGTTTTCIGVKRKKYDIQLNDLNNGTMYKYRLYNYKLAKEWYDKLKLAIDLHDKLKPDNLIKFD